VPLRSTLRPGAGVTKVHEKRSIFFAPLELAQLQAATHEEGRLVQKPAFFLVHVWGMMLCGRAGTVAAYGSMHVFRVAVCSTHRGDRLRRPSNKK
jgi:hypothetical protein